MRNCESIIFIIEKGTHDELLKQNGFYANLYNSQFEQ